MGKHVNYTCGEEYPGPTFMNDVILFMCPPEIWGNKVIITKKATGFFALCEVEVHG